MTPENGLLLARHLVEMYRLRILIDKQLCQTTLTAAMLRDQNLLMPPEEQIETELRILRDESNYLSHLLSIRMETIRGLLDST
jgi:hypothetical protein